ncbi:anti-sigma factor family protein [Actibacterium ureilyticum]|uniref:anti-sigma factor family protein n=1 Tax=Actibacterium ureilyticum TaxID=1590614 RepID=UPI000BAB1AE0|nr:anti-sigma factor [Actibacterium ureilyticum]
MTTPSPITDPALLERLSAYVDGALSPDQMTEVEALAARDPAVLAEIESLQALDLQLNDAFDQMLDLPGADALPPALQPVAPTAANLNQAPSWGFGQIAAMLAMLLVGAGGGWFVAQNSAPPAQVAQARGWMAEVADYHRVYATQVRHLAEVPASEKEHIEAWLGQTTGVPFKVPDLSAAGYTFQGARLLVAAGKPVSQLLYTDAAGQVLAICAIAGGDPEGTGEFTPRDFGDVQMVNWKTGTASYVVVGTPDMDLPVLARQVAQEI